MTAQVVASLRSDARDNRARILAVARVAFAAEGLDVPIREIARRAEVGVATVYRHFQTKEALLSEAFAGQMASCSAVVEEGLAAGDPWSGFRLVIERLMEMHALDRGFARAFTSPPPHAVDFAADRDRTLRLLLELVRRAKEAGPLRRDFVLEDISLALMANEGIRAESPAMRVAASRRFAALMIQSFQADPVAAPLPPAVRLPLSRADAALSHRPEPGPSGGRRCRPPRGGPAARSAGTVGQPTADGGRVAPGHSPRVRDVTKMLRLVMATACVLLLPAAAAGPAAAQGPVPAPPRALAPGSAAGDAQRALSLPRPTGPHAVGRSILELVDHSRRDLWVPSAGDRRMLVELFYPAAAGTGRPARYTSVEESGLLLGALGVADIVPAALVATTTVHSRVDARPEPGRHPLVLLSPGFGLPRFTLTGLAEDLASHGYVVASVDHAYESSGTAFPGGETLTCVPCERPLGDGGMRAATVNRARDLSFVVDRVTGVRPAWRYADRIDPARIGAAGHSLGGAAAASLMAHDRRVRAGVNLDGTFADPVPPDGFGSRAFLMLGAEQDHPFPPAVPPTRPDPAEDLTWAQAWARLDAPKWWLGLVGADHFSFTDTTVLAEELGEPASDPPSALTGQRALAVTRAYVGAFLDQTLGGPPRPLLDGPSPAYPEVRFHDR